MSYIKFSGGPPTPERTPSPTDEKQEQHQQKQQQEQPQQQERREHKCNQCYHQDISSRRQLSCQLCVPIPSDSVISRSSSAADLAGLDTPTMAKDRRAPIERLPAEIFDFIMAYLVINTPTNGCTTRNKDLASCLLVSRTFHYHTLATLYSHVTFPHSTIFSKFLQHIRQYPELGGLVRRLDFSPFTSVGLGRTMRMNYEIQKLTSTTLRQCLELTPMVREFLASESMGMDMNVDVLQKLFCDLPNLEALDFCGMTHQVFVRGIEFVLSPSNAELPTRLPIKRLGLNSCTTVHMSTIATILPRMPFLTHLDLTHTQVTDAMLQSIPHTARLTHLSLSRCNRLKGPAVVDFLLKHPACRELVYLNLLFDTSRYRLLSVTDVDKLLPNLPRSLKSLNLSGAKIISDHIPYLRQLAKHLEELGIGHAEISVAEVCAILEPGLGGEEEGQGMLRHSVRYLDLTGITSVSPTSLLYTQSCGLLLPSTFPLQVVELSEKVVAGLKDRPVPGKKVGWKIRDQGRRGWFVRAEAGIHSGGEAAARLCAQDDGARLWKMGGRWWGSRKIGCVDGEMSGIYGYYAFGN